MVSEPIQNYIYLNWAMFFFNECWDFILCNFEYFLFKVNYGTRNTNSNSAVHLHMLQESHMIIRNALISQPTKDEHLLDLYRESCGLLGEYYSKWVNNYFKFLSILVNTKFYVVDFFLSCLKFIFVDCVKIVGDVMSRINWWFIEQNKLFFK